MGFVPFVEFMYFLGLRLHSPYTLPIINMVAVGLYHNLLLVTALFYNEFQLVFTVLSN